jgi:hypothetical protein
MNYRESIYSGLVNEILEVIYKYEETMFVPSVLGCLKIVEQQILLDHLEQDDDE